MSLTNEQITAQNFKDFYNRIRPLLNSQHYHVDRGGQELLSLYAGLSTDSPETDSSKAWTATSGAKVPFVKISGSLTMPSTGVITIPAGARVELAVSLADDTANTNTVFGWYNDNTNQPLEGIKDTLPWTSGGAIYTGTTISQWTNDSNEAVNISYRVKVLNVASKLRYRYSHLTIKEIGRIVDPIQYTANNDELEETPVGNIISYMGNSVPKHYLACNGSTYAIGTYPELEAHFIDEFGSVNYFGGDGTTTWAVPNLNGEFLRGTGTNSHTNQGNGANVGVHQDGTEIPYIGFNTTSTNTPWTLTDGHTKGQAGISPTKIDKAIAGEGKTGTTALAGTSNFMRQGIWESSETTTNYTSRPTNTSVKFCIKYESTYHVIVPSHMYKVSVPFSVKPGSPGVDAILTTSSAIGDVSIISASDNTFVAPLTGWYSISAKSGEQTLSSGTGNLESVWRINGTVKYFNTSHIATSSTASVDLTSTVYLTKGDKINLRVWSSTGFTSKTFTGDLDFCLLTSNVHENIIAGGEVYSTEEQLVGTNTDGRPLYQKTFTSTLPSANADKDLDIGASIQDGWVYTAYVHGDYNASLMDNYWYVYVGKNNSTAPNKIRIHNSLAGWVNLPVTVTVQYTKTADQAGTYQYKNSLLLTRPDMWEPDTEYDFGGGLYGQRFTGTHSTAGASAKQLLASVSKIVDQGGQIKCPSWVTAPCPFGWGSNFYGMAFIDTSNKLMFNVKAQTTETATYDIWVTYKK